jgi:hypothetical protein
VVTLGCFEKVLLRITDESCSFLGRELPDFKTGVHER